MKPQLGSRVSVSRGDERAGAVSGKHFNSSVSHHNCQALNKTELVFHGVFRLPCTLRTLARPSILVEGKTRVACTGIGARNIRTQLLAIAIATFINVWKQKHTQRKAFLLNHPCHPGTMVAHLFWREITKGSQGELA